MARAIQALLVVALCGCTAISWGPDDERRSEPGPALDTRDHALLDRLIAFARAPSPQAWERVPTTEVARLGLGGRVVTRRRPAELASPRGWRLAPGQSFRGYVGPFSALDLIAERGALTRSRGAYLRCVSPPLPPPRPLAGLRRLTLQPVTYDSCLEWWAVDVYVTRSGAISAVLLDIWEP